MWKNQHKHIQLFSTSGPSENGKKDFYLYLLFYPQTFVKLTFFGEFLKKMSDKLTFFGGKKAQILSELSWML